VAHAQLPARPIDVGDLEARGLRQPQPAGIHRHEKGPVARLGRRGQDGLQLAFGIDLGPARVPLHAREGGQECGGVPAQGGAVEEAHRIDRDVDTGRSQAAVYDQMLEPDGDLLVGEELGRAPIESGQLGDERSVGLLSAHGPAPNGPDPG
jgi:hypothetical protein